MEEAIKKAIEGGWVDIAGKELREKGIYVTGGIWQQVCLDTLFWQALGKQQGWIGYQCLECRHKHFGDFGYTECCQKWMSASTQERWMYEWHRFIDHIADGGDVDEFFNRLLK